MSSIEQGFYSSRLEPLLRLNLHAPRDAYIELEALVDTGFNRSLLIFELQAKTAHLPETQNVTNRVYLADGKQCRATSTHGFVRWFGQLTEIQILVVHGQAGPQDRCLIGMELLRGKEIILENDSFEVRAP